MDLAKKEQTAEPLRITEDTEALIRLFEKTSEIFDVALDVFHRHYGERIYEDPKIVQLQNALQAADDAISDLIGFSVQFHFKGIMTESCKPEMEI